LFFAGCPSADCRRISSCTSAAMDNSFSRSPVIPNMVFRSAKTASCPSFSPRWPFGQRSQTIRFRTGAEMLDTFGLHKGGKEYRRLIAAFDGIFGATMFFGTDKLTSTAKVVQRSRFSFFREAQIWYNRHADSSMSSDEFENVIVLSDEFYQEAISHPIPTDLEAVKVLAAAPAVLDLYVWLSYR